MMKQAAPPEQLKIVKCDCKTDCTRKNWKCRQNRVVCTNINLGWREVFYMNCKPINDTDPRYKYHKRNYFSPLANQITSDSL